mgnify:CR=1 FL=1
MADPLSYETALWNKGILRIAGVDEVGRGSLAGPVVAAVVVLPQDGFVDGADDSKKINRQKREKLYDRIFAEATEVHFGLSSPQEIDKSNILVATGQAMNRALGQLSEPPDHVVVDGLPMASLEWEHKAIVRGDGLIHSISCASIVAKVFRDRLMGELGERYPGYGWDHNAGYGTKEHRGAIERLGISPCHRKTFLGQQYGLGI